MGRTDSPSVSEINGETGLVPGSPSRQETLVEHQLLGEERNRLQPVCVILQASRRQALPLLHSAQGDMGLERCALRWEADGLTASLDTVLQQLERGWSIHPNPENSRASSAGECSQLAQPHRESSGAGGGE